MIELGDTLHKQGIVLKCVETNPLTVKCISNGGSGWKIGERDNMYDLETYLSSDFKLIPTFKRYYDNAIKTI